MKTVPIIESAQKEQISIVGLLVLLLVVLAVIIIIV